MRQITIGINTENAAFTGDCDDDDLTGQDVAARAEAARILRHAAQAIEDGSDGGSLHDINGNKVGSFEIED